MAAGLFKASSTPKLEFSYIETYENPPRAERIKFKRSYDLTNPNNPAVFGLGEYLLDFKYASNPNADIYEDILTQKNSPEATAEFNDFYNTVFYLAKDRLQAKYSALGGKYARYKVVDNDIDLRFLTWISNSTELGMQFNSEQPQILTYNIKDSCELEDYNRALSATISGLSEADFIPGTTYTRNPKCFVPKVIEDDPTEEIFIQEFKYETTTLADGSTKIDIYQRKALRNLVTMEITQIEPPKFDIINTIIVPPQEPIDPSIYIYKRFKAKEIISDEFISKTFGVWGSNGELTQFYTSSIQEQSSKQYYLNVFSASCDDTHVFDIYYGDLNGGGTQNIENSRGARSYSKMIYSKYKNLCLEDNKTFVLKDGVTWPDTPDDTNLDLDGDIYRVNSIYYSKDGGFKQQFPTRKVNRIFAIKIPRNLYGDKLDEGNVELNFCKLNPTTGLPLDENNTFTLIDSSIDKNNVTNTAFTEGQSYDLISGSILKGKFTGDIEIANTSYGKFYPNLGLFILDADRLNSILNLGLVTTANFAGNNPTRLFNSISGSAKTGVVRQSAFGFKLRKIDAQLTSYYHININPKDFNYSNNPTFVEDDITTMVTETGNLTGRKIKNREFLTNPTSFITTVGLYDDKYQLLAVGKLSKALKKTDVDKKTLVVRLNTSGI